jgi:hypothetical protein
MSGTTTRVAFPGTLPTLTVTRQTVVLANNDVSSGVPNSNGQVTAGSIADLAAGGGYALPAASTTVRGGLRVDGVTCTISGGDVLSVVGGGSAPTGITTFMGRSTAAAVITQADINGVVTIPAASASTPAVEAGTGGVGVATTFARGDHWHPAIVVTLAGLPQTAATTGQAIVWNGSVWAPGTVSGGGGAGTVTSVAVTGGSTGLTTSGGPVTGSGTIALGGTLSVANGGTGATTLAAHGVVIGNGASGIAATGAGTSGQALLSNGASADPTFQTLAAIPAPSSTTPAASSGAGGVGSGTTYARADHYHPASGGSTFTVNGLTSATTVTGSWYIAMTDGTVDRKVLATDFYNGTTQLIGAYTAAAAIAGSNQWLVDQGGSNMVRATATQVQTFVRTGDKATLMVTFAQGTVVQNGTIVLQLKAPYGFTIDSLDYDVGSAGGSFTANVQIGSTSVTGLSAVAVSSGTSANVTASAANTVVAGNKISVIISSATGSPTGGTLNLNLTRT